jgi:hypothetical protein
LQEREKTAHEKKYLHPILHAQTHSISFHRLLAMIHLWNDLFGSHIILLDGFPTSIFNACKKTGFNRFFQESGRRKRFSKKNEGKQSI